MRTEPTMMHATGVAIDGKAVLLRGGSGSGKSDLALRLIERGHKLIADDYLHLVSANLGPVAAPPREISQLIEARGLGVVQLRPEQVTKQSPIALIIDLVSRDGIPRLPEKQFEQVLGVDIPLLKMHAFDASTPFKIELALRNPLVNDDGITPDDPLAAPPDSMDE